MRDERMTSRPAPQESSELNSFALVEIVLFDLFLGALEKNAYSMIFIKNTCFE